MGYRRQPARRTPIGVFRSVRHPTYGEGLQRELEDACAEIGPPELDCLLHAGDTWTVS